MVYKEEHFLYTVTNSDFGKGEAGFLNCIFERGVLFANETLQVDTIFKGCTFKTKANFNKCTFNQHADFSSATFEGEVDFSGAIFERGASFKAASFNTSGADVSFANAVFLPFDRNDVEVLKKEPEGGQDRITEVDFSSVKFGDFREQKFGDYRVWFGKDKDEYYMLYGKDEKPLGELRRSDNFHDNGGILNFLGKSPLENHAGALVDAFINACKKPGIVSFDNCFFGALDLEKLTPEMKQKCIGDEKERLKKFVDKNPDDDPDLIQLKNVAADNCKGIPAVQNKGAWRILSRHLSKDGLKRVSFNQTMNVSFSNASFGNSEKVCFSNVSFANAGEVDFSDISFTNAGLVDFYDIIFSNMKSVKFFNVNFSNTGGLRFRNANFFNAGHVFFTSASFSNSSWVDFSEAIFSSGEAVSLIWAKFLNASEVFFEDVIFSNRGGVGFQEVSFFNGGGVIFNGAIFTNDADVNFQFARFINRGRVDFLRVVFANAERVVFSDSIFDNVGGRYYRSINWGDTNREFFTGTIFLCRDGVHFSQARFPEQKEQPFSECYIGGVKNTKSPEAPKLLFDGITLPQTTFEKQRVPWIAEFGKEKGGEDNDFVTLRTILEKKKVKLPPKTETWIMELEKAGKDQIPTESPIFDEDIVVSWRGLPENSAKKITFYQVNLHGALFDKNTLQLVHLVSPKWLEKDGRKMLYAETLLGMWNGEENKRNLEDLHEQYIQLKNVMETAKNHQTAGDFYYGEMEIRRLMSDKWSAEGILICMYKWFHGYGEEPVRAFKWLLALVFLVVPFSLFLPHLFPPVHFSCHEIANLPHKYLNAFVELTTPFSWFKKAQNGINSNYWHYIVIMIGQILLYIQLPLFLLAVRRRFKR